MSESLTLNGDPRKLFQEKLYFPISLLLVFSFLFIVIFVIGVIASRTDISLGIVSTIPLIFVMVKYPKYWIYIIAITNIYFFYEHGDDVNAFEIILAIQYQVSLIVWLFWEVAVKRSKIIENIADLFYVFFLFIIVSNSIIAYMNSVELLTWARDAANLSFVAIYFPIRKYFLEKKDLLTLLIIYVFVVAVTSGLNMYLYYSALDKNILYAYQLANSIRTNQTLFTSAAVFGIIFALYNKSKFKSITLILFSSISIAGLLTSFSRTFWVVLLAELIIVFFYLKGNQRVKLIVFASITSILLFSTVFFVFQDKAQIAIKLVEKRFLSTQKGTEDISVKIRFQEYEAVWDGIKDSPLAGNGLGKKIHFWNFLDIRTSHTLTIHNGFLFIMFRLGIPALIVWLIPMIFYLFKSEYFARNLDDEFYRLLNLGASMSLLLMLISNFTATQLASREGVMVTALSFAFIGITTHNLENGKLSLKGK